MAKKPRPSIHQADVDSAIDDYLIAKIADLPPEPTEEEELDPERDEDLDSFRGALHGAVAGVLIHYKIKVIESKKKGRTMGIQTPPEEPAEEPICKELGCHKPGTLITNGQTLPSTGAREHICQVGHHFFWRPASS